uniref:Uncharacterized protein n=1 Tax=Strongyloides venezuelensis TaxID=75913 RepID=A0A0K0FKP2_STRVS
MISTKQPPSYVRYLVFCSHKNICLRAIQEIKQAFSDVVNRNRIVVQGIYQRNLREFNGKFEQFLDDTWKN